MGVNACEMPNGSACAIDVLVQPSSHELESGRQGEGFPRHWACVSRFFDSVRTSISAVKSTLQYGSSPSESCSRKSSITSWASFKTADEEPSTSKEGAAAGGESATQLPNIFKNNGGKEWDQLPRGVCAPIRRDGMSQASAFSEVRGSQSINAAPPTVAPSVSASQEVREASPSVAMPRNNRLKEFINYLISDYGRPFGRAILVIAKVILPIFVLGSVLCLCATPILIAVGLVSGSAAIAWIVFVGMGVALLGSLLIPCVLCWKMEK